MIRINLAFVNFESEVKSFFLIFVKVLNAIMMLVLLVDVWEKSVVDYLGELIVVFVVSFL